ncbi:glycoside hydrolase family 38 N-terminal domain-containing protein [Seonamhaeicola aphaedonensis]|uniref:Alpha-mannosidase n=1 Tax=Seonamhaeicola aphaedonensis TaxID=1461338 RepID=A0A3D9HDG1_9FLAO|nr:glycosyl hydrolase-related protein [Seonamhaeicola aphaedonensis]RED47500.1 alpha-mannosidase [Seonamhaeicola aphaedonensis]
MRNFIILVALICGLSLSAQNSKIEITDVKPTPFFPKVKNGQVLRQLVKLSIENKSTETPIKLKVEMGGLETYYQDLGTLAKGSSVHDIIIADVSEATKVILELSNSRGQMVAQKTLTWLPQKKWKVYYAAVSHQDLGFITYYQNIRKAVREAGIDTALDFCRQTDDWDENNQFRWNIETSEPLIRWISKQTPERIKEFELRVNEGRIGFSANHNTISSQMVGYEMLARSFYTPNRYVIDKLNVEPSKLALINDVTGITRSWPLYLKESDISYFMHGSNHPNCLYDMFDKPAFKWISPDGDTDNVPICRSDSYYSPNKVATWDMEGVSYLINRHVDLDWQYDCILAYDSHDFSVPTLENATNIKAWNAKYEYPKFRCSLVSSYFEDLESQINEGATIEETSKDAPDSWNDQEIIDADLLAKARRANYEIPTTEKIATMAMNTSGGYPEKDIFQAYNRIIMYHEHTNGCYDGGNHKYYETENAMHETLVDEAIAYNENALQTSLKKLGSEIKTKSDAIVIYNSLNWKRNDVVYLNKDEIPFKYFNIIDPDTNKPIKVQELTNGKLVFYAKDIPAMGYKTFALKEVKKPTFNTSIFSGRSSLENDFYKISVDTKKNLISDVIDKELNKNIVDKNAPYALGEYIHYDHFSRDWKKATFTDIKVYEGDMMDEIHIIQDAYLTDKVELIVYVHHNQKKLDFDLEVNKLSNGEALISGWNRYLKEASFCAIPVKVPIYQHHHELAGGVTQPGNKDLQFESAESSFYAIQHFADASNEDFGVTLSTIETNLVNYGHPRPVYWNNDGRRPKEDIVKPENSNMFLFLMNNFFQTNVQVDQPGLKKYTFSINSHKGNWQEGNAPTFGWESSHPLVSQYIQKNKEANLPSERTFLTTDKDNVVCTTLKKAEANGDGFIVRFFEMEGKTTKVKATFNLNQNISKAYILNLIEKDKTEINVTNNEVEFEINGHGVKTLRLLNDSNLSHLSLMVNAEALSNEEVKISWQPKGNIDNLSHYNVFRSLEASCEPNALNFIGTSETNVYIDKTELNYGGWGDNRVEPNTTYYYRVQPIDKANNRGNTPGVVTCKTPDSDAMDSKPNKVLGVYNVHVSPLAQEDYINLWFYTNLEKDVDKYRIHRSEEPNFVPNRENLIHELIPSKDSITFHKTYSTAELNRQMYADKTVKVNKPYYYKVAAVDNNNNVGPYSDASYAYMKHVPINISHEFVGSKTFETFRPKTIVTITSEASGFDMYYYTEGRKITSEPKKYTGPFEITERSIINVKAYKANTKDLVYSYRRFVDVNQNMSQSDYNDYFNSLKATDGSYYSGWVSKQYGGGTKEQPKDVWLGFNLDDDSIVGGMTMIADRGEIFPIHDQFRLYARNGEELTEINFESLPDKDIRNTFHVTFNQPISADGIMILFEKDKLPTINNDEQDGLIRLNEVTILDDKKKSIRVTDLLPIE